MSAAYRSKPGPKPSADNGESKRNYGTRFSTDVIAFLRKHHAGDAAVWIEGLIRPHMNK